MLSKSASQKGQSFVEMAFIVPLMALMLFGLIDVGYALYASSVINRMSREGANLASRSGGTDSLTRVLDTLVESAKPALDMNRNGRIYITLLQVNNGWANVEQQVQSDGPPGDLQSPLRARVSQGRINMQDLRPLLNNENLNNKETIVVVEVFYKYSPITPVGNFGLRISTRAPLKLYTVATFFLVSIPTLPT